jgi:hypothetical protein
LIGDFLCNPSGRLLELSHLKGLEIDPARAASSILRRLFAEEADYFLIRCY